MIVHTLRSLTRLALGSRKRPGKAEAGHASRSSGVVHRRSPPRRAVNGQGQGARAEKRILAWRNGDGRTGMGDSERMMSTRPRDMYHVVRMINTSTHTIMPYSYTRRAPLLRFSEFRLSTRAQTVNEIRDSRNVTTHLSLASVHGKMAVTSPGAWPAAHT
jgi:hypothetical protein